MKNRMSVADIRKALKARSSDELIDIICQLCKDTKILDQVNIMLGNDKFLQDALEEAKKKVQKEFYDYRGYRRVNLTHTKSHISEFKKLCKNPVMLLDLQLYYVECGIWYTNYLGDINASFYNSMGAMYEEVVNKLLELNDADVIASFMPRLRKAREDTRGIGYGFGDWMSDSFDHISDRAGQST